MLSAVILFQNYTEDCLLLKKSQNVPIDHNHAKPENMDEKDFLSARASLKEDCSDILIEYISKEEINISSKTQKDLMLDINSGHIHPAIFEGAYQEVYASLENESFQGFIEWALSMEASPPTYTINQIVTKNTPSPYSYDGKSSTFCANLSRFFNLFDGQKMSRRITVLVGCLYLSNGISRTISKTYTRSV